MDRRILEFYRQIKITRMSLIEYYRREIKSQKIKYFLYSVVFLIASIISFGFMEINLFNVMNIFEYNPIYSISFSLLYIFPCTLLFLSAFNFFKWLKIPKSNYFEIIFTNDLPDAEKFCKENNIDFTLNDTTYTPYALSILHFKNNSDLVHFVLYYRKGEI